MGRLAVFVAVALLNTSIWAKTVEIFNHRNNELFIVHVKDGELSLSQGAKSTIELAEISKYNFFYKGPIRKFEIENTLDLTELCKSSDSQKCQFLLDDNYRFYLEPNIQHVHFPLTVSIENTRKNDLILGYGNNESIVIKGYKDSGHITFATKSDFDSLKIIYYTSGLLGIGGKEHKPTLNRTIRECILHQTHKLVQTKPTPCQVRFGSDYDFVIKTSESFDSSKATKKESEGKDSQRPSDNAVLNALFSRPLSTKFYCKLPTIENQIRALKDDARYFFKYEAPKQILVFNDDVTKPLDLFQEHQGLCIGEDFRYAPKHYLFDNIAAFSQQGVKYLFLENLFFDTMQQQLDNYFEAESNELPRALEALLRIKPTRYEQRDYVRLIQEAKRYGIRVVALNTTLSGSEIMQTKENYHATNYVATKIIRQTVGQDRWVSLVGRDHLVTIRNDIPGICEMMQVPSVIIEKTQKSSRVKKYRARITRTRFGKATLFFLGMRFYYRRAHQ